MRKIIDVVHHRNGVGGNPFYVIRFSDKRQQMIGIVKQAYLAALNTGEDNS